MNDRDVMATYTIYRGASDTPAPFCVRQWLIIPGRLDPQPGGMTPASSLDQARTLVPASADYRMPRQADDDPAILETWV